jgi:anti-anti-sigma factor
MEHDDSPSVASLRGDLTIYRAAEVREELRAHLDRAVRRYSLAGITELDTAGLQLLVALRTSLARIGEQAEFLEPSECVRQTFELCGLACWLAAVPQKETT